MACAVLCDPRVRPRFCTAARVRTFIIAKDVLPCLAHHLNMSYYRPGYNNPAFEEFKILQQPVPMKLWEFLCEKGAGIGSQRLQQ